MTVLPLEAGNPVTKSKAMWDHGRPGVGSGCSNPEGVRLDNLLQAQVVQAVTYSRASRAKVGHQK